MDSLATTAGVAIDPDSIVPVQKSQPNRPRTKGYDQLRHGKMLASWLLLLVMLTPGLEGGELAVSLANDVIQYILQAIEPHH